MAKITYDRRFFGVFGSVLLLSLSIASVLSSVSTGRVLDLTVMAQVGGIKQSCLSENSLEKEDLARFAVHEHNKKENSLLEFSRLVEAKEQVVSGTMHFLTLETTEDKGKKGVYIAKVWVKPWLNFMELKEFTHVSDYSPSDTSDVGHKTDGDPLAISVTDPSVQAAANHAVENIQKRSNSLLTYKLQEILDVKTEVSKECAKYEMVLKVGRGDKQEKFKVVVERRNNEGGDGHTHSLSNMLLISQ